MQKGGPTSLGKRKEREFFQPYAVEMCDHTAAGFEKVIKNFVWPTWQFISNEAEKEAAMTLLLKNSHEWDTNNLGKLSKEDLNDQVKEYVKVYGPLMCKMINKWRNELVQKTRKTWMRLYKENQTLITGKQFLKVATRDPDLLLLLPEKKCN